MLQTECYNDAKCIDTAIYTGLNVKFQFWKPRDKKENSCHIVADVFLLKFVTVMPLFTPSQWQNVAGMLQKNGYRNCMHHYYNLICTSADPGLWWWWVSQGCFPYRNLFLKQKGKIRRREKQGEAKATTLWLD